MIAIFSVSGMLNDLNTLFTSNLKFMSSLFFYLLLPSWMWVFHDGSTYFGSHIFYYFMSCAVFHSNYSHGLHCHFCCFSQCLHCCLVIYICSVAIFCVCNFPFLSLFMSAYLRLFFLTPCSLSFLSEDYNSWCLYSPVLLLCESALLHVHLFIYTVTGHTSRLYTWFLLAILIAFY